MQVSQNYFYPWNNTEDQGRFRFIDLADMIANHGAKLLWGNGFILSSDFPKYQKVIDKWKKNIPFQKLFYQDFKIKSYWGYNIAQLDKSITGRIAITFPQPFAISRVGRVFENDEVADTYSRIQYDDMGMTVHTSFTKNEVRRNFILEQSTVKVGMTNEKISKDLQLPLYERHNYGVLPVKFMQNIPKKNFFGGTNGDFYPDMTPVKQIQRMLDHVFEQLWKEVEFNRTRVFLDISTQEINQITQRSYTAGYELQKMIGDFILQSNMSVPGSGQRPIEILQGNFNGASYADVILFLIRMAYSGSGYTYENENSTAQKTQAETLITQNDDFETTRIKRILNQEDWNDIFSRMFIMEGLEGDTSKWTFSINENQITDRFNELELYRTLQSMGIVSRRYIVEKELHMPPADAQQFLNEQDKLNLQDKELMTILNYEPENNKNNDEQDKETSDKEIALNV